MKNLFKVLGLVIMVAIFASCQTNLRETGSFRSLGNQYDTLVASQTSNYDLVIEDGVYGVLVLALESDTISGTSAYSAYLQKSLNGVDFTNVDTITHTGGNPDYAEFDPISITHTYYRISTVATATAQRSILKVWGRVNAEVIVQ